MNTFITAFGFFFRGVFIVGLALHMAFAWTLVLAITLMMFAAIFHTAGPFVALAAFAVPAFIGYRAWLER